MSRQSVEIKIFTKNSLVLQQNADLNSLLLLGDQIFLHVNNFDEEMDEGDVTARRLERLVQAAKNFD